MTAYLSAGCLAKTVSQIRRICAAAKHIAVQEQQVFEASLTQTIQCFCRIKKQKIKKVNGKIEISVKSRQNHERPRAVKQNEDIGRGTRSKQRRWLFPSACAPPPPFPNRLLGQVPLGRQRRGRRGFRARQGRYDSWDPLVTDFD